MSRTRGCVVLCCAVLGISGNPIPYHASDNNADRVFPGLPILLFDDATAEAEQPARAFLSVMGKYDDETGRLVVSSADDYVVSMWVRDQEDRCDSPPRAQVAARRRSSRCAAPCSIVHFVEWDELAAKKLAVSEFDIPTDARMLTAYVHCSLHGVVQGVTFGADEEDVVAPPPPQPPQPSSGPSQYATFEFRPHTTPASTPHSHTFLSRVVEDQLPEWCARAGLDGVHCGMCR